RDLSLRDVIQAEGKREFRHSIAAEIDALDKTLAEIGRKEADARRIMKAASDWKAKAQILDFYRARLQAAAERLQASPVPSEMLRRIAPNIPSGSSEYTRRLLAYFISVLHTIHRYSSSTYCPVVIDAINQQDQSRENLERMYQQLADGLPSGTQLILG